SRRSIATLSWRRQNGVGGKSAWTGLGSPGEWRRIRAVRSRALQNSRLPLPLGIGVTSSSVESAGAMSSQDLLRLIGSECVRLRQTGVELSSCSRRLRANSSDLLNRLRSVEEYLVAALGPLDALLFDETPDGRCAATTLPDKVLRTSQELREAAQRLV